MKVAERLAAGLAGLGTPLPANAAVLLSDYLALLARWNRAYNLTAVHDPAQMVTRHVLDSLAVLPFLQGSRVVDVGSGAGLPGIPLAVARPEARFVLLDSNSKKTRFLHQVAASLQLANVEVVHARVQAYRPALRFSSVISRAFASLADFINEAGHLCAPDGRLLAMKGTYPAEELARLPTGFRMVEVIPLQVPGLAAERHLVCLAPDAAAS